MEHGWNGTGREKRSARREMCPSATFFSTNTPWISLRSNPGVRFEMSGVYPSELWKTSSRVLNSGASWKRILHVTILLLRRIGNKIKFWNVVILADRKDQLARWYEKRSSNTRWFKYDRDWFVCVNKPHCAAAVRPWESEATTSTLPPTRVRTCSVLSGSC